MNGAAGGSKAKSGPSDAPGNGGGPESRVRAVVEVIAKALTDYPDQVRVTESRQRGAVLVELFVAAGDLGRLIGRQGRTAAAIRTLAATAGEQEGKTVTLEFRESR
jgi:predicted RNA-binding protein YlqC (UPF0109 family)